MTIFEKIVKREIPAFIVYEDDLVLAFLDIQQSTKGHTLVITKEPYKDIFEIPNDLFIHLMDVVKKISNGVMIAFNAEGLNIVNNNKKAAGQTVFHYHVHVIPRYINDDFKIIYKDNSSSLDEFEYKKRASAIRKAL